MASTLNSDNGAVSGSAGLKSSADATGVLALQTNGTTAVTVDTSQNVGIGTASPATKLHVVGAVNATTFLNLGGNTSAPVADAAIYRPADGTLGFVSNAAERMRIDSSGNLLVGATSLIGTERLSVVATGASSPAAIFKNSTSTGDYTVVSWNAGTTGNNQFLAFYTEASPTLRGSITYNRAGGLTVYNTTSDYRAKTVNGLIQNALSKVCLLKPSTGRMNGATENIDFFVAHELQEVVPSAVTGEKDAVNKDATPKYQMVDKSALIPLLTAAIQEQQALITQLQADVAALKGK